MHRLLTGYSQYYNRKYRRSGHLLQGRHKSILCQSDPYLAELVRYIHLNPVRAKMVRRPADYPFSSHHAYMGAEKQELVDVDPVLRRFGPKRETARIEYERFVIAAIGDGSQKHLYSTGHGILGSEEFVDATIHRIGEFDTRAAALRRRDASDIQEIDAVRLIAAVESVCDVFRDDFCGPSKAARPVFAKEAFILAGRQLGAGITELSQIMGLSSASVSRRHDIARRRMRHDRDLVAALDAVTKLYQIDDRSRTSSIEDRKAAGH